MAKNINIKMSTMMETLSEMDGVEEGHAAEEQRLQPVQKIGGDRRRSENRPRPPPKKQEVRSPESSQHDFPSCLTFRQILCG